MYKLLATDLDGTLLSNYEVSDENKKALDLARKEGLYVVLCSGRPYTSMEPFVKKLELKNANDYGICYNGGRVYKTHNFEPIYDVRIHNKAAIELLNFLKSNASKDVHLMCYIGHKLIAEDMTEEIEAYVNVSKIPITLMPFDTIYTEGDVSKILLKGKKEALLDAREKLDKFGDIVSIHFSSNNLLEVVDKNVSKANGLKYLGEHLGVKREEIIAVGDNHNDLSMIKYAGLGLAVANAADEVKAAADYVLESSCDQNALKEVVNKFIRGNIK